MFDSWFFDDEYAAIFDLVDGLLELQDALLMSFLPPFRVDDANMLLVCRELEPSKDYSINDDETFLLFDLSVFLLINGITLLYFTKLVFDVLILLSLGYFFSLVVILLSPLLLPSPITTNYLI